MKTIREAVVGDEVVVVDPNFEPRRTVVVKVGRKFFYVKGNYGGFDRETGKHSDAWGNTRAVTLEEHERELAASVAERELASIGVRIDHGKRTPARVLAVRAALDALVVTARSIDEERER